MPKDLAQKNQEQNSRMMTQSQNTGMSNISRADVSVQLEDVPDSQRRKAESALAAENKFLHTFNPASSRGPPRRGSQASADMSTSQLRHYEQSRSSAQHCGQSSEMQESELEVNARRESHQAATEPLLVPYPIYVRSDNDSAIDHYLGNSATAQGAPRLPPLAAQ